MRIVKERVVHVGAGSLRSGASENQVKDYLDRVSKYIPAEVLAAYIAMNGMATSSKHQATLFAIIFIACITCTPIYITRFTTTKKEAWTNSVMAVIAFAIWAYATGQGIFTCIGLYDPPTASVLLALFTFISGAVVPVVRECPPKPVLMSGESVKPIAEE